MLKEKLMDDLKSAMREKDDLKKDTVQMIRAAILQIEKDSGIQVDDNKIIEIIAKESKKRKDAAADFEKSGRQDLIERNNKELEIINSYLPAQLSKEEIETIIKEIIATIGATSIKDMGNVMKEAKAKIGAQADGKTINEVVRALLS
jgi:uncharacterized protein YqeY